MGETVKELVESPEFSHKEVTDPKKEKADLKRALGNLETEDKRTQFQTQDITDQVDKLDTATNCKKKNLFIESIPEQEGRMEEVEKVIGAIFDQMNLNKVVNVLMSVIEYS